MELHRKSFVWLHIVSIAAQCSSATFIVNSIEWYRVDSKEVWNCRLLSFSYRKKSVPIECNHIQNEETSVIMVFAFFLETIIHPFMAKVQVCILFAKEQLRRSNIDCTSKKCIGISPGIDCNEWFSAEFYVYLSILKRAYWKWQYIEI